MQSVLLIEAVSTGRYYAAEIARRGFKPVVVFPDLPTISEVYAGYRRAGAEFARHYTDDVRFIEGDNESEIARIIREIKPAAVIAGSEIGVPYADKAARLAGVAGNPPETSLERRDKFAMVQALMRCGIPAIRSAKVSTLEECLRYVREWNTRPIVLKPLSGAGTLGVHFCSGEDEIRRFFTAVQQGADIFGTHNTSILVQEFARGTELIVNTVSCRGVHAVTDVWEYRKIAIGSLGNAYDYAKLITKPAPGHRAAMDYALRVLDALDFQYGPSHTEIMLTDRGPLLIETGARPMGAVQETESFREALGHCIVDVSLDTYLDPEKALDFARKPYAPAKTLMTKVFISPKKAKIAAVALPVLCRYLKTARSGDFRGVQETLAVEQTVDLATTPGELLLCGTEEEVMHDYAVLRRFETEAFDSLFPEKLIPLTNIRLSLNDKSFALFEKHTGNWLALIEIMGEISREVQKGDVLTLESDCVPDSVSWELLGEALGWHVTGTKTWTKR